MAAETYHHLSDLPDVIPIFPLAGALLLPRWSLPLNIFEPRYLNMVDDAMAGHRLIGMIQPTAQGGNPPDIADVGCVGRITAYSETDDGRYLISLTGICRFAVGRELDVMTPYRQVRAQWTPYADDLSSANPSELPNRERLKASLQRYVANSRMEVDWQAVEAAALETLINALCAGCPFSDIERQALLEAPTVRDRALALMALLDMQVPGDDTSTLQ